MSHPDSSAIRQFLDQKIVLWNQGKEAELEALYRGMAPKSLTFEFVGSPVIDGWEALKGMWRDYGESIEMELVDVLINGSEVACYVKNHVRDQPGVFVPSIEVYVFEDGTLHERYFHQEAAQA
jgi:hypothetical protein